jgi:hypothetical protein
MLASQTEGDSQLFATLWLLGLVSHHEISSYTGLAHVIPTFTSNQVKITQKGSQYKKDQRYRERLISSEGEHN